MTKANPPAAHELEISLFGPGVGECAVAHLGDGNWIVVDSCLNESRDPIALEYLKFIGVDVRTQVKLVIVTHWHDDHIQGVARLLDEAVSAKFACSAALRNQEFARLLLAHMHIKLVAETSGVSEFADVMEIQKRTPGRVGPDRWVTEGACIYSQSGRFRSEVYSLSPSSQTITDAHIGIGRLFPKPLSATRRIPTISPNDSSIALVVKAGEHRLLLGADLEKGRDAFRGWRAVLQSTVRPSEPCGTYKVAHHGSEGADLNEIWTHLLESDATAIIAPYARGSKPLPSEEDVGRMKSRVSSIYCTAWPPTIRPARRKHVDGSIDRAVRTRRSRRLRPGHIRLRFDMLTPGVARTIELFDGAVKL